MSEALGQLSLPMSTSSAGDSHVRTCPGQVAARALLERARVCGVSTLASSLSFAHNGSSLRTSQVVRRDGSTGSCVSWNSSAMTAYLFLCRRAMSELFTCADDSSLLPTAVASTGQFNQGGGSGRTGPRRYGLTALATRGELPTLTVAGNYNRKGMSPNSGDGLVTALRETYPTLCRRDEKGPGPAHTRAGADLPQVMGGHLNQTWLLWFMGFPRDWLDVNDGAEFGRSETRLFRNARKSLGG